jgi:hypothetical protein
MPSGKKQKSRFHRQLTAKNDFNNRPIPLSDPIVHPPKIATKEKSNATTYPRPRPAVKSFA